MDPPRGGGKYGDGEKLGLAMCTKVAEFMRLSTRARFYVDENATWDLHHRQIHGVLTAFVKELDMVSAS